MLPYLVSVPADDKGLNFIHAPASIVDVPPGAVENAITGDNHANGADVMPADVTIWPDTLYTTFCAVVIEDVIAWGVVLVNLIVRTVDDEVDMSVLVICNVAVHVCDVRPESVPLRKNPNDSRWAVVPVVVRANSPST